MTSPHLIQKQTPMIMSNLTKSTMHPCHAPMPCPSPNPHSDFTWHSPIGTTWYCCYIIELIKTTNLNMYIFSQVRRLMFVVVNLFGHVQNFWSYSFGHLESVMLTFLMSDPSKWIPLIATPLLVVYLQLLTISKLYNEHTKLCVGRINENRDRQFRDITRKYRIGKK